MVKGNAKTDSRPLAETKEQEEYMIANREVRPCVLRIHRLKPSSSSRGVLNARLQQAGDLQADPRRLTIEFLCIWRIKKNTLGERVVGSPSFNSK